MLEEVLNMPAFRFHLTMFCVIITRLVVYFEFLYDSGIIYLPLNIPEKLH